MSAFAELIGEFVQVVIDLTVLVVEVASSPLRFVISPSYRKEIRSRWQGHLVRCSLELFGGSLALLLFVSAIFWWVSVLRVQFDSLSHRKMSLRERVFHRLEVHRQQKNQPHD